MCHYGLVIGMDSCKQKNGFHIYVQYLPNLKMKRNQLIYEAKKRFLKQIDAPNISDYKLPIKSQTCVRQRFSTTGMRPGTRTWRPFHRDLEQYRY